MADPLSDPAAPLPVCHGDRIRAVWAEHEARARLHVPGGVLNAEDLAGLLRRVARVVDLPAETVREAVYG